MEKAVLTLTIKANIKGDKNASHPEVGKLTATHFEVYKRMFEEEIDSLTGIFPTSIKTYSSKRGEYELVVYVIPYNLFVRKDNGRPEKNRSNRDDYLSPVEFAMFKVSRIACFTKRDLFNTSIETEFKPLLITKESEPVLISALTFLSDRIKNIGYIESEYKEEIMNVALESITAE